MKSGALEDGPFKGMTNEQIVVIIVTSSLHRLNRPLVRNHYSIQDFVTNSPDGKLEGPAQLAAACNTINNTTGVVLKRSGRKIKQYMTVKGIKLYFSFNFPNNGRMFGDAGYLHARYTTESGDWVILPAGTSQTRQSRE